MSRNTALRTFSTRLLADTALDELTFVGVANTGNGVTEDSAVFAPKRRVRFDMSMTDSLTGFEVLLRTGHYS